MPLPLRGITFLERGENRHWWIVLTDDMNYADEFDYPLDNYVLVVNSSRVKTKKVFDRSCILKPDDHPFITEESYIFYLWAKLYKAAQLMNDFMRGALIKRESFDLNDAKQRAVFERVCDGLLKSEQSPPALVRFFEQASAR